MGVFAQVVLALVRTGLERYMKGEAVLSDIPAPFIAWLRCLEPKFNKMLEGNFHSCFWKLG